MRKFLITIVAALAATGVMAQLNPMEPIPMDKEVRMGKLENGMTYYIRHNEKPKGQADFYILHDVGAIQEEDNQQGLAHFLEHMAFNGTKNLPGKEMLKYLEKVGVKFGQNLNAGTSWDHTLYMMQDVPTQRQGIIDTALLVLHDWSHFIALQPEEIDNERGVIMEELRTRDGASWRSSIKGLQAIGKGTRYENRNLIGYLDYLKTFPHEALVDFYHQWYRPDYQAVMVVGDIDVDQVENQIKSLMADIPAPAADASQKQTIVVPDNEEPIISIYTDPEMQYSTAEVYFKRPAMPEQVNSLVYGEMIDIMMNYMSIMGNARLHEIAMKPDAPFVSAYVYSGSIGVIPTLDMTLFNVRSEEGKLQKGIEAIYTEAERLRRHGFTQSEFELAQNDTNRNDRTNNSFIDRFQAHYQKNQAIPDAETEWKLDSMLIQMISVDDVNMLVQQLITPQNQVVVINAPEKAGLVNPTEQDVLNTMRTIAAADNEVIAPYADNSVKEPLISEGTVLDGSPVTRTEQDEKMGTIEWTLQNGTKIIVKPTTFKADEVQMYAFADGGSALLSDPQDVNTASTFLSAIRQMSGVSNFSTTDLRKVLSGKTARVNPWIDNYNHGLNGNGSPKDLETLLQLVYLNFTAPRFNQDDFNAFYKQYKSYLENFASNPDYTLGKELTKTLYGNTPLRQIISLEMLDNVQFDRLPVINSTLYPDANEFTFTFVGNVDPEVLKPLVEKYIGSIPTSNAELRVKDDGVRFVKGEVTNDFRTPMQQPKVGVVYAITGDTDYTVKNNLTMALLSEALNSRYLESIREEKGGSYGVHVGGNITYAPVQNYVMQIVFDTNEEMADELMEIILKEFREIAENGPRAEDIEKTREFLLKDHNNSLEQNGSWINHLKNYYTRNTDFINGYEETLSSITYDDVRDLARKILADDNIVKVVMRPEAAQAE